MSAKTPKSIPALVKLLAAAVVGLLVGLFTASLGSAASAPLVGYDAAVLVYLAWVWSTVQGHDAKLTAARATAEDPTAAAGDFIVLSAGVVSLAAVATVEVAAGSTSGTARDLQIVLALASVILSWVMIHTAYMLKYAKLYYQDHSSGVEFNSDKAPDYIDFAYLAFTIGMTFQVSDTNLTTRAIRRTALRHALLSYLFGSVILATTINLIAGLGK